MMVFLKHDLVFLATPKTGTTALEAALRPHCSIDVKDPPGARHMAARRYRNHWQPLLGKLHKFDGETMAVLREPVSWLRSWYKYQRRDWLKGKPRSTLELSFDQYVEGILAPDPPEFAMAGSQHYFATGKKGRILVDHLFIYEDYARPIAFIEKKLGTTLDMQRRNVSPEVDAPLSPDLLAELRRVRSPEFELYESVAQTGHLVTPNAGRD